jgi:hypothetical protein
MFYYEGFTNQSLYKKKIFSLFSTSNNSNIWRQAVKSKRNNGSGGGYKVFGKVYEAIRVVPVNDLKRLFVIIFLLNFD